MQQKMDDREMRGRIYDPYQEPLHVQLWNADPNLVEGCHNDEIGPYEKDDSYEVSLQDILANYNITELDHEALILLGQSIEGQPVFTASRTEVEAFFEKDGNFDRRFAESIPYPDNKSGRDQNLTYVALTHHATVSNAWRTNVMALIRFLQRKTSKVSYNLVIPAHKVEGQNKNFVLVDHKYTAHHAGQSEYIAPNGTKFTNFAVNARTYGVAIDHSNKANEPITQHHFNGLVATIIWAWRKLGIPPEAAFHKLHLEVARPHGRKKDIELRILNLANALLEAKRIIAEQDGKIDQDPRVGKQEIIVEKANIRDEPNTNSTILDQVPRGTDVFVLGLVEGENRNGNSVWGQLEGDRYIHTSTYGPREKEDRDPRTGEKEVTAALANVREGPSKQSKVKQRLMKGTPLWIETVVGDWLGLSGGPGQKVTRYIHSSIVGERKLSNRALEINLAAARRIDNFKVNANETRDKVVAFVQDRNPFKKAA